MLATMSIIVKWQCHHQAVSAGLISLWDSLIGGVKWKMCQTDKVTQRSDYGMEIKSV